MNVRELIEELQRFDQDAEVVLQTTEILEYGAIGEIFEGPLGQVIIQDF